MICIHKAKLLLDNFYNSVWGKYEKHHHNAQEKIIEMILAQQHCWLHAYFNFNLAYLCIRGNPAIKISNRQLYGLRWMEFQDVILYHRGHLQHKAFQNFMQKVPNLESLKINFYNIPFEDWADEDSENVFDGSTISMEKLTTLEVKYTPNTVQETLTSVPKPELKCFTYWPPINVDIQEALELYALPNYTFERLETLSLYDAKWDPLLAEHVLSFLICIPNLERLHMKEFQFTPNFFKELAPQSGYGPQGISIMCPRLKEFILEFLNYNEDSLLKGRELDCLVLFYNMVEQCCNVLTLVGDIEFIPDKADSDTNTRQTNPPSIHFTVPMSVEEDVGRVCKCLTVQTQILSILFTDCRQLTESARLAQAVTKEEQCVLHVFYLIEKTFSVVENIYPRAKVRNILLVSISDYVDNIILHKIIPPHSEAMTMETTYNKGSLYLYYFCVKSDGTMINSHSQDLKRQKAQMKQMVQLSLHWEQGLVTVKECKGKEDISNLAKDEMESKLPVKFKATAVEFKILLKTKNLFCNNRIVAILQGINEDTCKKNELGLP
ncbi:uncharacterized protein FOMMEDRAFT_24965 [Fomitiporia mediterranea MF3/22]|uniref:uncharacterized protein n=1 Tax=Fomitiporia mediterranea (strain MF3/22) TaxID=694068 RepID=UPI0004408FD8|nr:uncharacterized protein FOMMEDRAFT_24965 [Fomitiporia mediterranea MF3/22]EJD07650.1 hypothetical protein FOMMEDRAFT_24965 [Fomitiporia mediterranea MF3/22]